jgi:hypothetical protein
MIMEEGKTLINIGELSKPASVLIEKISEAVGGIYRPYHIRRVAQAEADAEKIKTISQIEVTDLQRRAMPRFLEEEAKKQQNIENITNKALPEIGGNSTPEKIENDWLSDFFDKCRLISDDDMQRLWAKVLAGEANEPGHFSKRTISLLSSLDKADALLFEKLCGFNWWVMGATAPLVYDLQNKIYLEQGINFESLKQLDAIGLISFEGLAGYQLQEFPKQIFARYEGRMFILEFKNPENNSLDIGKVMLSKAGRELAPLCNFGPHKEFKEYILNTWASMSLTVTMQITGKEQ